MIFKGNVRLFDKPEQELDTSTETERLLTIDGVNSLSDIDGRIIPVVAKSDGGANATLKINELDAKNIMFYENENIENVRDSWIVYGQLYIVMYVSSSDYFLMFNYNHNMGAIQNSVLSVNSNILGLTDSSSAEEITAAFGTETDVSNFISAIQTNRIISLFDVSSFNTQIPISYNSITTETNTVTDSIVLLDTLNQQIKTLAFTRTSSTFTYTAVKITTTDISGGRRRRF